MAWLTFRQFAALMERHSAHVRRQDLRFGVVASVVANVNRDSKKRPDPYTAEDFFPDPDHSGPRLPRLTVETLRAEFVAAGVEVRSRSEAVDE